MLVERPFLREYAGAQLGNYKQNQQLTELQLHMEKLNQCQMENYRRYYHEVQENKVRRWQPVTRFNHQMAPISSKPFTFRNPKLGSEGSAYRKNMESKRPVHRNFPKIKQEVSAFGPKHAEHARLFYQSKRTQPIQELRQDIVPSYRPNYGSMQVSGHRQTQVTEWIHLLGKPLFGRSLNQKGLYSDSLESLVPVPDTSQPYETVLKIAKISPRLSKKQPTETKASIGFCVKLLNHKVERGSVKKSYDFQDCGCEIDLSKAPAFQMLCEISNTQ